jgi:hypothetical protein
MQQNILKTLAVLIGTLLFNLIFWHEKQGVNVLIFDLFIGFILVKLNAQAFKTRAVQIVATGTFVAALLIILHNSLIVKVIHFLSLSILIGLVQETGLRFLGSAFLVYLSNWFTMPKYLINAIKELPILRGRGEVTKRLNSALLSILIVPIFFLIYYVANPKFATLSSTAFTHLWNWFSFDIDVYHFLFFIIGLFIVGAAILQQNTTHKFRLEDNLSDNLIQKNELNTNFNNELNSELNSELNDAETFIKSHAADLQNRYKNALNLIITLNVLLLINNVLDIQNVWFDNNTLLSPTELKQFVHEGTYVLIMGIALAISVTLVLFRGILNFAKNAEILRGSAYLWLAQNAVLAVSVGMRNWRYIDAYGLAYKRIGVFIFLLLVFFGLSFIYLKIKEKRTLFFFITRSSWAIYSVLLLACFINWDVFITKYNLTVATKSNTIDARFLLQDVSEKNLKTLLEYHSELLKKMPSRPFLFSDSNEYVQSDYILPNFPNESAKIEFIDKRIQQKRSNFEFEQEHISWLSWNYADAQIQTYLKLNK